MRASSTLVLFALAASSVSARTLSARQNGPPDCALPCLAPPKANYGSCGGTDNSCLCKNQAFIDSSTQCIYDSCSAADFAQAQVFAQALCSAYHLSLTASFTTTGGASSTTAKATTTKSVATTLPSSASSTTRPAASPSSSSAAGSLSANTLVGAVSAIFGIFALTL